MVNVSRPWEVNPVLEESRLLLLAETAIAVRNKAVREASWDEGDTSWGVGCKAHERLGHALGRLAESGKHPWLTVHRDGLYLMPHIEGVAVRIYRGAAERPSQRHLDALCSEHRRAEPRQMTFSFMAQEEEVDGPWFWMMALETDPEGRALRAVFLQVNEAGEIRHAWQAPLDASAASQRAGEAAPQVPAEPPARPSRPRRSRGDTASGERRAPFRSVATPASVTLPTLF